MMKVIVLSVIAVTSLTAPAIAAETLLAPVNPLSWAVSNADWGGQGAAQMDALRKVVNGQVTAHQVMGSYTDPKSRVVKRVKCTDPSNCIMCSNSANESAKKLRSQFSNTAGSAQDAASQYTLLSNFLDERKKAIQQERRMFDASGKNTITETAMVDGQEVTTSKTVTVVNGVSAEMQKDEQILAQLQAAAQAQAQQQGQLVYTYLGAAVGNIQAPAPAVEVYVGEDPLR